MMNTNNYKRVCNSIVILVAISTINGCKESESSTENQMLKEQLAKQEIRLNQIEIEKAEKEKAEKEKKVISEKKYISLKMVA